jgi:dihydroorotate dehydrogenase (fumarate)
MAELHTRYLGLNLRNPVIVGSSGLTKSLTDLKEAEKAGAGAVVLKSLFEEQIYIDATQQYQQAEKDSLIYSDYSESLDYLDFHLREKELSSYLSLLRDAKNTLLIPVIASINCVTTGEWTDFARRIEENGADALEINIAILPYDETIPSEEIENRYIQIISDIRSKISIPIAVKIGLYFTNPARFIKRLSETGINGIVMFNRFFNPDIDIDDFSIISTNLYSSETDLAQTLRWIGIMHGRIDCNIAASTGVHSGEALVKTMLVGANAVQVNSMLYKHGVGAIQQLLGFLEKWMDKKGYKTTDQFIGKMSQFNQSDPKVFERIQFMRYYSEI